MPQSTHHPLKADGLFVLVTLFATVGWIFSKEALHIMPPFVFMALRFILAAALLYPFCAKELRAISIQTWQRMLPVALLFALALNAWVLGLYYGTHLGAGSFLTSLGVVLIPLVSFIVYKEKTPKATWLALPIAIVGLAFLTLKKTLHIEYAQLFYVGSAIIFSVHFILSFRLLNQLPFSPRAINTQTAYNPIGALPLTCVSILAVGLCALLLSILIESPAVTLAHFNASMLLWVVLSALFSTAIRFLLQTYAQRISTSNHGGTIMMVEPIWVSAAAFIYFGETMSIVQMIGCVLIFSAVIISRWSKKTPPATISD